MNFTDIFSAIEKGTLEEAISFIEEKKADVNIKDSEGWTPLHYAIKRSSNIELLEYLVSEGADVNAKSNIGNTPLHSAACSGNVELARFLICAKAKVNAKNSKGITPANMAKFKGDAAMAKYISSEKFKRAIAILIKAAIGLIGAIFIGAIITFLATRPPPSLRWYTSNLKSANFTISTAEELAWLAQIVNGTLERKKPERDNFAGKTINLVGNIDLSQYENWVPIGNHSKDSNSIFSGTFNGNGHVISGLTINRPDADRQGLFGRIDEGKALNLGLDKVNIKGYDRVGAVAGVVNKGGSVVNCYSIGKINGNAMVGGVAGTIVGNSNISNSYSTAEVNGNAAVGGITGGINRNSSIANSYFAGIVNGRHAVGGIAGSILDNSNVVGSYSTGAVSGNEEIGGIAGQILTNSSVSNSYSIGAVNGSDKVGGITGSVYTKSLVTNSYSMGVISGTLDRVGGVAGDVFESRIFGSYSTAAISGREDVGGVAGVVRTGTVDNCAALNSEVKGSKNIGRVFGNIRGRNIFSNNIAYSDMLSNDGNAKWRNKGAVAKDGLDIKIDAVNSDGALGERFLGNNGWSTQNGSLPGIGAAVPMPGHLTPKQETKEAEAAVKATAVETVAKQNLKAEEVKTAAIETAVKATVEKRQRKRLTTRRNINASAETEIATETDEEGM